MASIALTFPSTAPVASVTLTLLLDATTNASIALPSPATFTGPTVVTGGNLWSITFSAPNATRVNWFATVNNTNGTSSPINSSVAGDSTSSSPTAPSTPASSIFQPGNEAQQPNCTAQVIANSPVVLLSRVLDQNGVLIVPGGITSISAVVSNVEDDTAVTQTFTPSSVVLPTPVTDGRWTVDAAGYNLALVLSGTAVPTAARTYQCTVTVTPTTGYPFALEWNLQS